MELERDQFEEVALAHFVAQRAAGVQISGDNGCEPTRESLFWRDDKGDYGVRMFNAAWWGWKEAVVATRKTCEVSPLDAALARLAEIESTYIDEVMNGLMLEKAHAMGLAERDAALARLAESEAQNLMARQIILEHGEGVAGASPQQSPLLQFCTCEDCKPMECEGCRINRERRELLPAPDEAAREYMTGYSDGREWAAATQPKETK